MDQTVLNDENQEVSNQEVEIELDLDGDELGDEGQEEDINLDEGEENETDESAEQEGQETDEGEQEGLLKSNPIRQLRTVNRELKTKARIAEEELKQAKAQLEALRRPKDIELPAKPTLESCDFDPDKLEEELTAWFETKSKYEAQVSAKKDQEAKAQQAFQTKLQSYEQAKPAYKGINEAEEAVKAKLNVQHQGIIVQHAKDPALVVYALGKNPLLLNQLASYGDDYIGFAFKMAEIEKKASEKMANQKRTPPNPESKVSGGSAVKTNHEKNLEALRNKGDFLGAKRYREKHNLDK